MKKAILAMIMSAGLAATPALAQNETDGQNKDDESAAEAARQGIESLMRALELVIDSIPMFELPELLPNGDIIIRRIDPEDGDDREEGEDDEMIDETRT